MKDDKLVASANWVKGNMSNLIIAAMVIVYVLYGIISIDKTGKTITEILLDGVLSFVLGFTVKSLMNKQGLVNGEMSSVYTDTKRLYGAVLDRISPIAHNIGKYCDYVNEKNYIKAQTDILRSGHLRYDDFINNRIKTSFTLEELKTLSKYDIKKILHDAKIVKKACSVKITEINEVLLLSDMAIKTDYDEDLNTSKTKYYAKSRMKNAAVMLMFAVVFGYYTIDANNGFNWAGALWNGIQMVTFIGAGVLEYINGYAFMTDDYRAKVIRKINHLEKFENMFKENPNMFREIPVEETQVQQVIQQIEQTPIEPKPTIELEQVVENPENFQE